MGLEVCCVLSWYMLHFISFIILKETHQGSSNSQQVSVNCYYYKGGKQHTSRPVIYSSFISYALCCHFGVSHAITMIIHPLRVIKGVATPRLLKCSILVK